ncbi:MAG TPA: heparan N-sulfatase, partial [Candidatus Binatia bacterium]|nr:heparan N-sulfatase [Candidatus Binatia bacterium]
MKPEYHSTKYMLSGLLTLALTATFPSVSSANPPPRPNFLIILADDCTYNDLPVYGGQNAHTPNLDSLASEGL